MSGRLSKDNYLWSLAYAAAARGTCDRFRGGCVVARDGVLISTGYNGSAPGEPHCDKAGHEMVMVSYLHESPGSISSDSTLDERHCIRTIHAEVNAIVNAAYLGVSIAKCDWYITGVPCWRCSRIMTRLKPKRLFVCLDFGGVTDDKHAIIAWWKKQRMISGVDVIVKPFLSLAELGVARAHADDH